MSYLAGALLLSSLPCSFQGPRILSSRTASGHLGGGASGPCVQIEWALHLFLPPVWGGLSSQEGELLCVSTSSRSASHPGVCFVSEPGYYEDGAFGIRIENVVLVVPVKTKVSH